MSAARLLRTARRSAGLSQRALAIRAGIPQSTIGRIETGQLSPQLGTMDRLLRATGRTLATEPHRGAGVDRSLIRDLLRLTPDERLRAGAAHANAMAKLLASRG